MTLRSTPLELTTWLAALLLTVPAMSQASAAHQDPYPGWRHTGRLHILTTPEGANLPAKESVENFPLLIRLTPASFDFDQAKANGEDLRFSGQGKPLAYQIENWDAEQRTASIWVRIPRITGNAHQSIQLHWGKPAAKTESDGRAVFNQSNGYLSVWHMDASKSDATGTLTANDTGTTSTTGMIGSARSFPGGKGMNCGEALTVLPRGSSSHSTSVWFRGQKTGTRPVAWGNEKRNGKVTMLFASPPHIRMDCYFSSGDVRGKRKLAMSEWTHVVHTFEKGASSIYVNGVLDSVNNTTHGLLDIQSPARLYIGGWYNRYGFTGDIDEVRLSTVTRSAAWVRLQYENQKPLQTLAGHLVQAGTEFSLSKQSIQIAEGSGTSLSARADGAEKVYWTLKSKGKESVIAVDQFVVTLNAGRVTSDESQVLQFMAVYRDTIKTAEAKIEIKEAIEEPVFTLSAASTWNGRKTIEVVPQISNMPAMRSAGASQLSYDWSVSGLAVIKEVRADRLILTRAQNSGELSVSLALSNGGSATESTTTITVTEPDTDAWVQRVPDAHEKPVDNQFYARDDANEGSLHCNGRLESAADEVELTLYADGKKTQTLHQKLAADGAYAFTLKLTPGLIKYRVELIAKTGRNETVIHRASNLVCGDAYIIEGQSNALATDTRAESPRVTNEWIRSYGRVRHRAKTGESNLWCLPVWKAQRQHKAELGWWGMELAKNLLKSQKVPICIINGAQGGTRIDQHQRNPKDHEDLETIYGRLLWRVRQAHLSHGIRAVLWHQGENDQGAAGPTGRYGWETYQQYFVQMSAAWKQDFPNLRQYYIYQIWPNSCSMGRGNGDMLREVQRTLPALYSNMDILSTLGVQPPGSCHFPLPGWAEFADMVQPLIERDFYGVKSSSKLTPPNVLRAYFTDEARRCIALEFDQPVIWHETLLQEFYLDDDKHQIASGKASRNTLSLQLKNACRAESISYLHEMSWSQSRLLVGKNGLAALTFCKLPIHPSK